jgi:hypothetical protein
MLKAQYEAQRNVICAGPARRYAHTKPTVRNSNFDMVRWAGVRGDVPVHLSGAFEHWTGNYGR